MRVDRGCLRHLGGQDDLGQERHQEAASSGEVRTKRAAFYALGISMSGPYCTDKADAHSCKSLAASTSPRPYETARNSTWPTSSFTCTTRAIPTPFHIYQIYGYVSPLLLCSAMLLAHRCLFLASSRTPAGLPQFGETTGERTFKKAYAAKKAK